MKKNDALSSAVKLVNEAIAEEIKRIESFLSDEEHDPIMIEGETETGHYCQLMVNPTEVAKIFLRYNCPIWRILEEDAPEEMWRELGRVFGLKTVISVDL